MATVTITWILLVIMLLFSVMINGTYVATLILCMYVHMYIIIIRMCTYIHELKIDKSSVLSNNIHIATQQVTKLFQFKLSYVLMATIDRFA